MARHLFLEKIGKRALTSIVILTLCWLAIAHPTSGQHIMEMYSVLPFAIDKNGNVVDENFPIREWLKTITEELIDEHNRIPIKEYGGLTFYQYLTSRFDFKLSFGNHRILFHWGYNANPWNKELEQYVIQNNWSEEKIRLFKDAIRAEQKRRNTIANSEAEKVFGFSNAGKEAGWANGILAIVYDIHLLGDYVPEDNRNFRGVTEPSEVAKDIIKSIQRIDRSKASKKIIESIRIAVSQYSDQNHLATQILKVLQEEMPAFLLSAQDGALKRRFKQKGYKLKS